jgi:hypothetical protein
VGVLEEVYLSGGEEAAREQAGQRRTWARQAYHVVQAREQAGQAYHVVQAALLLVGQDLVGVAHLAELLLGRRVVLVHVLPQVPRTSTEQTRQSVSGRAVHGAPRPCSPTSRLVCRTPTATHAHRARRHWRMEHARVPRPKTHATSSRDRRHKKQGERHPPPPPPPPPPPVACSTAATATASRQSPGAASWPWRSRPF